MIRELLLISTLVNSQVYEQVNVNNINNNALPSIYVENLGTGILDSNELITVVIQFDYDENSFPFPHCGSNYYSQNMNLIQQFTVLNQYDVSSYSPFVFNNYSTLNEYQQCKESLIQIANSSDLIKFIYVDKLHNINNANSEDIQTIVDFGLTDIKEFCEINDDTLTGQNINIGFIENGRPSKYTDFPNDILYKTYNVFGEPYETDHAMQTIYLTTNLARNAKIFCSAHDERISGYKLYNSVEWLLEKDVDIINMSRESGHPSMYGLYTGHAAYIDFITNKYNIIFVKSSGNNKDNFYMITTPGTSINVLTVGGVDKCNNNYENSSYEVNDSLLDSINKPTLVAPSVRVGVPVSQLTNIESKNGTSFAAPIVTGIIALLMEKYTFLKDNPSLIISSLISGANLNISNTEWDERKGAGIVSFKNTDNILSNMQYATVNNESNILGTTILNKQITIPANSKIEIGISRTASPLVEAYDNQLIATPKLTSYDLRIYLNNNVFVKNFIFDKDSEKFVFYNNENMSKNYTIKLNLFSDMFSYEEESISLSYVYTEHEHTIQYFIKKDEKNHWAKCYCGYQATHPHEIKKEDVGKSSAMCLRCLAMIDLIKGMGIVEGPLCTIRYSKNGSYIHPSGIVVLVDEDIEPYHNGDLEFVYNEEIELY